MIITSAKIQNPNRLIQFITELFKKFKPLFSVFIRKQDLPNFSYKADEVLADKSVCFFGKVDDFNGTPTMDVGWEEDVSLEVPKQ